MTIALVSGQVINTTSSGSFTPLVGTFPNPTTTGNTVIIQVQMYAARPTYNFTISDNHGNTYTKAVGGLDAGSRVCDIYYCAGIVGGSNHQITVTPSGGSFQFNFFASEFTGITAGSSVDQTASNNAIPSSTSWTGGAVTTSQSGDIVYGAFFPTGFGSNTYVASGGYTLLGSQGSQFCEYAAVYQVAGSAGSYNPGVTLGQADAGCACTASFKAGILTALAPRDGGAGAERTALLILTPKMASDLGVGHESKVVGPIAPQAASARATGVETTALLKSVGVVARDGGHAVTATNLLSHLFGSPTTQVADFGIGHEITVIRVLANIAATDGGHGGEKGGLPGASYVARASAAIVFTATAHQNRSGVASAAANIRFRATALASGGRQVTTLDHRYIGRYQVGEPVTLHCQCVSAVTEVVPDAPPVARIYREWALQAAVLLPKDNTTPKAVGRFRGTFILGPDARPGLYTVVTSYLVSGNPRALYDTFEVVPGGHPSGRVLSLCVAGEPAENATIAHLSLGRLEVGTNPILDKGF